jgi:UDP-N-acetylglucosamine transferase subunit ALG13
MILVTLGTQKQQFTRLLDYIENSNIDDEIIVQAGFTKYESKKMQVFDFIDYDRMNEYIDKADLIITHAGTGSIVSALKKNKKVIACARLSKYLEHVDDHQEEILDVFYEEGFILKIDDKLNMNDVYEESKKFKPKKFVSNTDKFIKRLELEIK